MRDNGSIAANEVIDMSVSQIINIIGREEACHLEPLILVEEISHRVFNEYSCAIAIIRLAAASSCSHDASSILLGAASKLQNFAEAHRALQCPRAATAVDLGDYLAELCEARMAADLTDRNINLTLICDTVRLSAARCWRVGLIVSELITNAVRHGLLGGPGQIAIRLEEAGGVVACEVSDNGHAVSASRPARGMSVINGLTQDLGGAVHWRFENTGTSARVAFPLDPVQELPRAGCS